MRLLRVSASLGPLVAFMLLAIPSSPAATMTQTGRPYALRGVSARSTQDVWVVGNAPTGVGVNTASLTLHWNGTAWSKVSSPNPRGTGDVRLSAVSDRAAHDVWGVGDYSSTSGRKTLILHWDGTAWKRVSTPNPSANGNFLTGVSAVSATDAWAVGYVSAAAGFRTLILHWNGSAWSRVKSPNPGAAFDFLYGVSAVSTEDAWAVGTDSATFGSGETLALHWNGSKWSRVSTPNATSTDVFYGVSAPSSTAAWAVGSADTQSGRESLTEHWNGSAWSLVASPNPGTYDGLNAVSALSPTDAWAVGTDVGASETDAFIIRWDGSSWSRVKAPAIGPSPLADYLVAVSAATSTEAWSVGYYCPCGGGSVGGAILIHWNGKAWKPQ